MRTPSEDEELLSAAKEFVQWFDYLEAYDRANLVDGQTLETAAENWKSMVEPSPPIERLRNAIKGYSRKQELSEEAVLKVLQDIFDSKTDLSFKPDTIINLRALSQAIVNKMGGVA